MKTKLVRDLMVPLAAYATVAESATLHEAVQALEAASARGLPGRPPCRAVLVLDAGGKVVGKVGFVDVLRGLEPKYRSLMERRGMAHLGFTRQFLKGMVEQYNLWEHPFDDICRKASAGRVRDFMYTPADDEIIEAAATLGQAAHQIVMGHHQSLLVVDGGQVVGILRLSDLFAEVAERIKACEIKD
jgi:CBS domain-containing protein